MERIKTERMVCIGPYIEYVQETVDIPVLGGWISTVFCNFAAIYARIDSFSIILEIC